MSNFVSFFLFSFFYVCNPLANRLCGILKCAVNRKMFLTPPKLKNKFKSMHQVKKNRKGSIKACRRKINLFPYFFSHQPSRKQKRLNMLLCLLCVPIQNCPIVERVWIGTFGCLSNMNFRFLNRWFMNLAYITEALTFGLSFFSFPVLSASNLFCKYARSCIFYGLLCTKSAWKVHDPGSG